MIQFSLKGKQDLTVGRVEVENHEYEKEIPERMRNKLFPGFPSTCMFCGPPGSGKTNLFMFMLLNKGFWNQFFDLIYLWGPTIKSDILYRKIDLPEDQIFTDPDKYEETLKEKMDLQTELMEQDRTRTPKTLFVFEDMTAYKNTFQSKEIFHRAYTQIRHVKGTAVSMIHKYKGFDKINRDATQHFCIFRTNLSNQMVIAEDHCPKSVDKKTFEKVIQWATDEPNSFLYINTFLPYEVRFRKNFDDVIAVTAFLPRTVTWTAKRRRARNEEKDEIFEIERTTNGKRQRKKEKKTKERRKKMRDDERV